MLNIDQNDYVKQLAHGAGIRLLIHPQDRMPFPQDEGILASPGHLTSIGIRQVCCHDKDNWKVLQVLFVDYMISLVTMPLHKHHAGHI